MGAPIEWNEQNVEKLKGLLSDGKLGMRMIAAEMGTTKNSVVSKVHRLGLARMIPKPQIKTVEIKRRGQTETDGQAKRALWHIKAKRDGNLAPDKPLPKCVSVDVVPLKVGLMELTDENCHWPIGDPLEPDFSFCGCAVIRKGSPYCEAHRRAGYDGIPQPKRRLGINELAQGRGGNVGRTW